MLPSFFLIILLCVLIFLLGLSRFDRLAVSYLITNSQVTHVFLYPFPQLFFLFVCSFVFLPRKFFLLFIIPCPSQRLFSSHSAVFCQFIPLSINQRCGLGPCTLESPELLVRNAETKHKTLYCQSRGQRPFETCHLKETFTQESWALKYWRPQHKCQHEDSPCLPQNKSCF